MTDDTELLRRYAEEGSQAAFAELVQRQVNLVYTAALRQVHGDAHLAADATQLVFTDLARKARALTGHRVLAGWLFTSARYAAAKLVRGEQRRRAREEEAGRMEKITADEPAPELDWAQVGGVLDEALAALGRTDREAVLLRFFEGRDYAGVGAQLHLAPNAARMRVERALEKLRGELARRGVASTAAALAGALAGQAVAAAPAGLAASVTGTALAGATGGTGLAAAILMSMSKLQIGVTGALVAAGAAGVILQSQQADAWRGELAELRRIDAEIAQLRGENRLLAQQAAEAADLRRDDARLAQLREEAAALQAKLRAQAAERDRLAQAARAATPLTGEIFDLSRLDRTPTAKFQARPEYPAELRTLGVGGTAVVDFVVDAEGAVRLAKAVRSSVDAAPAAAGGAGNFTVQAEGVAGTGAPPQDHAAKFAAAAVEAVSKWKFAPGEKGGQKVNTRMQIPIVFTLGEKGKTPAPTLWF